MKQKGECIKVIVAGLPRTGTMSMKAALEELGYGPCHHLLEPACQISRLRRSAAVLDMEPGEGRQAALSRLLEGYEVCLDVPGSACVDDLLALYPDAKVILTTRKNGRVWLDSYDSIFTPTASFSFRSIGYWVPGVYSCSRMVLNWNRHYESQFPGTTAPSAEMYDKHSEYICAATPASNFLEFEVGAGWETLCEFLEKPIPAKSFPRRNERSYLVNVNRLAYVSGLMSWLALLSAIFYLPWSRLFVMLSGNKFVQTVLINQVLLLSAVVFFRSWEIRGICLSIVGSLNLTALLSGTVKTFTENGITNAVLFSCMCVQFFKACDSLMGSSLKGPLPDIVEGFNSLWNMREIGGPGQIRNIPKTWSNNPIFQTRTSFILQHTATFIVSYLLLEIVSMAPPSPPPQSLTEAAIISVASTAAFWVTLSVYLSLIYDVLCIIQVALFMSEPSDWPPLFGSISEAYSIRRFWGVTWHQTLRKPFGSHAKRILGLLGISNQSILGRYLQLFIVFGLSGLLHWIADSIIGVPWSQSWAMQFFVLQVFGIVLEDFIKTRKTLILPASTQRVCGYLWLATWLIATTPAWMNGTAAHVRPGKDTMLPLRVFTR